MFGQFAPGAGYPAGSGYTAAAVVASAVSAVAGGVDLTPGIDFATMTKEETGDALASNTLSFEYYGDTPPTEWQSILVTRGLSGIEFAGTVLRPKQFYNGIRHNIGWRIACQDWTWLFNDERFTQKWSGAVSATTIAQAIVALKSGFTSNNVEASLPNVTDFEIINKTRGEALHLLGDLISATVIKVDYALDVHFRVTPLAVNLPTDITDVTKSGDQLMRDVDGGQLRTRQRGLGVRVRIPSYVPSGSTTLPVESVDQLPSSGSLLLGSRLLTFSAQSQTQKPSGIANSPGAPTVALASSPAGGVLGAVRYCITGETPDGETAPGTQSSEVTGATIAAPGTGTAAKQHTIGGSFSSTPDDYYGAGSITLTRSGTQLSFTLAGAAAGARVHIYQTGTGAFEGIWTVASVSGTTVYINGVSSAAATSDTGYVSLITSGFLVGAYNYKFGWLSPRGISALSSAMSATGVALATAVTLNSSSQTTGGSLTLTSTYYWYYTILHENGETAPVALTNTTLTGGNNALTLTFNALTSSNGWDDMRARGFALYRGRAGEQTPRLVRQFTREYLRANTYINNGTWTYTDVAADADLGALPAATSVCGWAVGIYGLPSWSDARVTGLAVLRTIAGGSTYYLNRVIQSGDVTSFTDTMSDEDLLQQPAVPTDSFGGHAVSLSSIPTVTGATARNIYRLLSGVWRYCGTIPDNVTTTFTDTRKDEELGRPLPIGGYLTGISATASDIAAGEVARLYVVRNNTSAQSTVAAIMGRGDGVFDGPVIDNDTLQQSGLEKACDDKLTAFADALESTTFRSRDVNLQPGKSITFNLGSTTNIVGTFTIQRVTTKEYNKASGMNPLRHVSAGPVLIALHKTLAA